MRNRTLALAGAVCVAALAWLACSEPQPSAVTDSTAPADSAAPVETTSASPETAKSPPHKHKARRERPLPAFSGWTLDNERLDITSLIGKRLLIYFFNPEVPEAKIATEAVKAVSSLRGKQNFEIVGVATGSNRKTVDAFAKEWGIDFPVIDDSSAAIANQLGLRQPLALFGVDDEGYVVFGVPVGGSTAPGAAKAVEAQIRDAMRLPSLDTGSEPVLGSRPEAPLFEARVLDSEEPFRLADHRGEAVIVIFFLHTCPHCHETLAFFRKAMDELPADKRPLLVGIEVTGRSGPVRRALKEKELDFFPVLFDDDGSIQNQYGVFAGVPDTFFIDAEGGIAARVRGWQAERDEPLARMRMAKLAGAPIPMLLRARGFTGSEACGVCHEAEHETWLFTRHARAYDTLVKHGAATDEECVGCHVVGYEQPGGFTSASETPELEDVGCEMCHGRGGPHLSPEFVQRTDYSASCLECHDQTHSLGFEYTSFRPRISHAANANVLALSVEEKQERLAAMGVPRDVLPTGSYVGSEACQDCHAEEYGTWAAGPHAHAVKALRAAGKAEDATCLKCHTTAFGRSGGFAESASVESSPDLARVGCESCHGPGGNHVEDGVTKLGSIVSLGDKCDSCVILQICGACHDDANDPGFEFAVQDKIEAIRHGTIEAGTGKPKGTSAQRLHRLDVAGSPDALDLERAFDLYDRQG